MTIAPDRIVPLCDILLGAAYADQHLHDREKEEVRGLIEDLAGQVPREVDTRISSFDPKSFDLAKAVAPFRADSADDRRKLLVLVSAVIEADEEIDLAEDDYLRAPAKELALPDSALEGLTVDVHAEELEEAFSVVSRAPPPPPPPAKPKK